MLQCKQERTPGTCTQQGTSSGQCPSGSPYLFCSKPSHDGGHFTEAATRSQGTLRPRRRHPCLPPKLRRNTTYRSHGSPKQPPAEGVLGRNNQQSIPILPASC